MLARPSSRGGITTRSLLFLMVIFSLGCASVSPIYPNLKSKNEGLEFGRLVGTTSQKAQEYFSQGLLFYYGYNADEAYRSFESALKNDPNCGICHWGKALAKIPYYDEPGSAQSLAQVQTLLEGLKKRKESPTPYIEVESALIRALLKLYGTPKDLDLNAANKRYAEAMKDVFRRFPKDADVGALTVHALMSLSSPGCHQGSAKSPNWNTPEIRKTIDQVLKVAPFHPGANHFAIHSAEVSGNPKRALDSASVLPRISPGMAHFVHMPSHLYIQLGRYREAAQANQEAILADQEYFKKSPEQGEYFEGFYLHNHYFLWASALLGFEKTLAFKTAENLQNVLRPNKTSERQRLLLELYRSTPSISHVYFKEWAALLELPTPNESPSYSKLIWHFARTLAFLKTDQISFAKDELARLTELQKELYKIPSTDEIVGELAEIASHLAQAELYNEQDGLKKASPFYRKAISLEDKLPYTEPPFWILDSRVFFAQALNSKAKHRVAIDVIQANIKKRPNHAPSLRIMHDALMGLNWKSKAKKILQELTNALQFADAEDSASLETEKEQ